MVNWFLPVSAAVPNKQLTSCIPLKELRKVGAQALTVLKRFGKSNPSPLSFPIPGWTLTADVPANVPGLLEVLDRLDEEVANAGGRVYLAKDARQSARMFRNGYGIDFRDKKCFFADKTTICFRSDLANRLDDS